MIYATEIELIAELVYQHRCQSRDCICLELRRRPAIDCVIRALHTEKLRAKELADQKLQSRAAKAD